MRAVGERTGCGPQGSVLEARRFHRGAPSPGKGTQTGGPSCPGPVSAAAARGRDRSPGGLARECRLPPSGGGNVGAPTRGPTRLGRAGRASHPHSSPTLRALHRIVLVRAPPRGQLRRRTAARVRLREPVAGGRVRGLPREGIAGGDPNPGQRRLARVPVLGMCGRHPESVATAETHPHLPPILSASL